jgi:ligand-binding sensor domain-containing protein/signal transduction histidine kinase
VIKMAHLQKEIVGSQRYSLLKSPDLTICMKKRFTLRACLLLCLCVGSIVLAAQPHKQYGISPGTPLKDCSVDQWTGDNGLLSNNLTSAMQASSGFLWIATNNGLMRFDGIQLKIFDRGVLPFLATDAFYRIYEDKNQTLWFATRGSGIVKYQNERFESYLPHNPLIPKSLRTMYVEDDGTIWAGSDNKGLIRIRDTTAVRIDDPLLENIAILSLDKGADNSLYIGTNNKGLLRYVNGTIEKIPVGNRFDHYVNAIKCDRDGNVYIGTTEGLFVYRNGTSLSYEFLSNVQVNHISIDPFGSLWIATERGLGRINEKYKIYEFLQASKSFPGAHISSVFPDKEGSLWMSTGKSGLLRIKESPIRNYNENHGLSVDRVNVVTEGHDGKYYICLDDGFVNVFDKGTITNFPIQQPLWNESVRDILVENDGTMWICSYKGILRKNRFGEKLFTTDEGLSSNSVRRVLKDSKGNLWFGTRTGGVMKFVNGSVAEVYNRRSGLSSDYILAIEENAQGDLLIGTHSGGLNIIKRSGEIKIYHLKEDDDGVLIFNIHIDENNQVYLATSVGLYHFSEDKGFTRIPLAESVKGESFFDWVEDNTGNVWITTNIGILQFRKTDVLSFLSGKSDGVKSKIFNDYDGMKNKECTGATRSLLSSSGEVWVPTIEGVCIIDPERMHENMIVPPVYITEVVTDREVIQHPRDEIVVEPGNFRITFHFTSLSLLAPNKVKFKYRLDRVDDVWREAESMNRSVDYTNLPPGKYTFSVKAANNDGKWNEQGFNLRITIKPYYYQTAWFYFVLFVFLLLIFFLIYKWRVSAIEQKNEELLKVNTELDRFVYSASHDLRAPLTSVLGLVKLTRIDPDPQNKVQYLDMVEKSIYKLDGFIHDIINYSRNARTEIESRRVDFNALIEDIMESLKYQDRSAMIRKEVHISGTGEFFTDWKRLEIVLFNLISNAIKYHNADQEDPYIKVTVQFNQYFATVEVADNGKGIEKEHVENIFKMFYRADESSTGSGLGLFIARETIEKIKGTLTVRSTFGKGSTFSIRIPSLNSNI